MAYGWHMVCNMQQAALMTLMIFKYLNATEQPTACRPKWRHIVRSTAVASRAYGKLIFLETVFWLLV